MMIDASTLGIHRVPYAYLIGHIQAYSEHGEYQQGHWRPRTTTTSTKAILSLSRVPMKKKKAVRGEMRYYQNCPKRSMKEIR